MAHVNTKGLSSAATCCAKASRRGKILELGKVTLDVWGDDAFNTKK